MTTVTLAQVAERAGVSTATVSMVLRNRGRISQATRDRVLKALDDAGYVYNQTAANLRNRSSNQVGLLLHDITNPFYGEMTAGLSHEMERHDLLLAEHVAAIGLLHSALESLESPYAYVLQAVVSTLPAVTPQIAQRMAEIATHGPPVEQVGLDEDVSVHARRAQATDRRDRDALCLQCLQRMPADEAAGAAEQDLHCTTSSRGTAVTRRAPHSRV